VNIAGLWKKAWAEEAVRMIWSIVLAEDISDHVGRWKTIAHGTIPAAFTRFRMGLSAAHEAAHSSQNRA